MVNLRARHPAFLRRRRTTSTSFTALVLAMFPIILFHAILDTPMCNLYSQTKSQDAMRHVFDDIVDGDEVYEDMVCNLPPMAGIFPD